MRVGTIIALICGMRTLVRAYSRHHGFTMIELMIAIVIVGVLVGIALANYGLMQDRAKLASCISNQKHVHTAAFLYAHDTDLTTTTSINVDVLTAAGFLVQEVGDCPSSQTVDWDDYNVQYTSGTITAITCAIRGGEHLYAP